MKRLIIASSGVSPSFGTLIVKDTPDRGRGVFAAKDYMAGELIHIAPVIPLKGDDAELIQLTSLSHYVFNWGDDSCVALGLGSLFNHSDQNNAAWRCDFQAKALVFYATSSITSGEEICTDYGYTPQSYESSIQHLLES